MQFPRALYMWLVCVCAMPSSLSSLTFSDVISVNQTSRKCHPVPASVLMSQFAASLSAYNKKRWLSDTLGLELDAKYERRNRRRNRRHLPVTTQTHNASVSVAERPPWHCAMTTKWKRMKAHIYPRHVQTGRCRPSRCYYDIYECTPRKYVVRVLKRKRNKCRPVPRSATADSVYEHVWHWAKLRVTVGCECSQRHGELKGHVVSAMLGL